LKKFAILAALVATSAAFAAPANAAHLVRISLADKSTAQIDAEIRAAAQAVCADREPSDSVECVASAIGGANRQLSGIIKARANQAPARRETLTIMRVSLKGKSTDQIHADIKRAAETVCWASKPANPVDYRACVGGAVRSAKAQLQAATVSAKTEA
jgi:hypothetical protein